MSYTVIWMPRDFAWREPVAGALRGVVAELGLARRLRVVRLVVRPRPGRDEAQVAWRETRRGIEVRLDLDLGNFLTADGRRALGRLGGAAAWAAPRRRYSGRTTRATLLHELSHVADGVRHGIDSNDVPRGRWASFNEAWNVWIDGRLTRRGSPALSRGERLAAFRHTFGRRGRTHRWSLPIFNRLWRAEKLSQRDLLDAVELLVS
jgi:hypothetical protein